METAVDELKRHVRQKNSQKKGSVGDMPRKNSPRQPVSGIEASGTAYKILKELTTMPWASAVLILIIVLTLPITAHSQLSVHYSPNSVVAWGQAHGAQMISVEYANVGVMSITRDPYNYLVDKSGGMAPNHVAGIYVIPFKIDKGIISARLGGIYFNKEAPTSESSHTNLYLSIGIQHRINHRMVMAAKYIHISNGYTQRINMGYDFPTLSLAVDL